MLFDYHTLISIFYAFLGGFIPAIIWLFFWNEEDRKNPEPKGMIFLAFMSGVLAVFISLYLEKISYNLNLQAVFSSNFLRPVLDWLKNIAGNQNILVNKLLLVVLFAPFIEEFMKLFMAYIFALRTRADDEPIDPMIYMITTALGFAAMENMLFLIDPIMKNNFVFGILTGNMRFIGATLLHTISSAAAGIFISFNFFDKKLAKFGWTVVGLILAVFIHSVFNIFMIGSEQNSFIALEIIWIAVIIVLLAFEKIKRVKMQKI